LYQCKDYEELQGSIELLIKDLKREGGTNIPEKNVELYSDLRSDYEAKAKQYNEIVKKQNNWLTHSETCLEQKYKNPFDPDIPEMVDAPEDYADLLNKVIDELNKIIRTHNQRVETKGDLNAAETAKLTHLLTKKDRLSEKVEALEIRASDLQRQIDNANQMDSLNTAMAKQADKDK
jgi:uncharacterized phage infection (PIP) family protein YhgE